jgi:3-hydroxyacyl-[acyl-carrier-protein] dehydratase
MASLDIDQIMTVLPHRPPMLLLERILDYETGIWATGSRRVTEDEACLIVGTTDQRIMPASLVLELMNQTSAMILLTEPTFQSTTPVLAGFEKARFRKPITAGDDLVVHTELYKFKRNIGRIKAEATVGGVIVATADIISMLIPSGDSGGDAQNGSYSSQVISMRSSASLR